ncbi:MAG: MobQ family relaxase [Steroidobacteraceae bacterium]
MAIYHYTHKPVSRREGQSAVAGAAYRAGERLYDHSTGQSFDYSRKRGVEHTEIVLPEEATRAAGHWARNRQGLWNAAERAEKRRDARIAREHEVALPHELNRAQQIGLLRAFAAEIANRYRVAVDFALHRPHRQGDPRNFHAHVYATTREITATGLGAKASIELSETDRFKRGLSSGREEIKFMRARFAEIQNEHLRSHGIEARVDHRTLEAQGVDRVPTTHLGVAVLGLERRGVRTEVVRRIEEQSAPEAQRRLERAAALGWLEREGLQLEHSMVELSADLTAARALRAQETRQIQKEQSFDSHTEAQAAAERWAQERRHKPPVSLEEERRRGREAWLQRRRQASVKEQNRGPERDLEQEKEREPEQNKQHDRGYGIDEDM